VSRSGGCSVAANPEPAAPGLAVVAGLALALARRRRSA
jgi:MYXO-CTERM domain-containing protein